MAGRCGRCGKPPTITCDQCNNMRYCSEQCQKADERMHQSICASFKDFSDDRRPSSNSYRAIVFPVGGDKPVFRWMGGGSLGGSATFTTDLTADDFGGSQARAEYAGMARVHIYELRGGIIAQVYFSEYPSNEHLNKSLFMLKLHEGFWIGPILFLRASGGVPQDLDTPHFNAAIEGFMVEQNRFLNMVHRDSGRASRGRWTMGSPYQRPSSTRRDMTEQTGVLEDETPRIVKAFNILPACDDQDIKVEEVQIPSSHSIFADWKSSAAASRLGLNLITYQAKSAAASSTDNTVHPGSYLLASSAGKVHDEAKCSKEPLLVVDTDGYSTRLDIGAVCMFAKQELLPLLAKKSGSGLGRRKKEKLLKDFNDFKATFAKEHPDYVEESKPLKLRSASGEEKVVERVAVVKSSNSGGPVRFAAHFYE